MQDMIAKHAKDIYHKIVTENGHVYVCGDVAMAADVNSAICKILQDKVLYTAEQAKDFVKEMKVNIKH